MQRYKNLLTARIATPIAGLLVLVAFGVGIVVERDVQHSIHSGDVCDFATANANFEEANQSNANAVADNVYQIAVNSGGVGAANASAVRSEARLDASLTVIAAIEDAKRACGTATSAFSSSPTVSP